MLWLYDKKWQSTGRADYRHFTVSNALKLLGTCSIFLLFKSVDSLS